MYRLFDGIVLLALYLLLASELVLARTLTEDVLQSLPSRHPGSQSYPFNFQQKKLRINNRDVDVFLPTGLNANSIKTAIVFGHGQAIGLDGYKYTFIHLARKGIPVIFPQYDKNFFDTDWLRLGKDYNELTYLTLAQLRPEFDIKNLIT